ncbi:MAG: hypothetical protein IH991_12355 [Planctomycetes bacterium]|nr:hypothetical protein [Planctomycetota bacterium]
MANQPKRVTFRRVLLVLLVVFIGFAAFDYVTYESRSRRATKVVNDLEGRSGSIGGWPFNKEYYITFGHPLTDAELDRLVVLNSLANRDYVAVVFKCDLTPDQLAIARRALSQCRVSQFQSTEREH